jgi:nucleotide-binding universal stress UspA family protein
MLSTNLDQESENIVSEIRANDDPSEPSVVPADGEGPVVVGVDGSANAQRALGVAANLARAFDFDLAVFHALGLMTVIDGQHVPSEGRRDEIEQLLNDDWCSSLQGDSSFRWHAEIVYGSPADVLLDAAHDLRASYVVVGSRGTGGELQLGSTSNHVVHHCDCPVVVVPPSDRTAHS